MRTLRPSQVILTLTLQISERGRERDQLRSKYKNPTENSILFMSVAPSPQTAGCDIMMGLWLQFEYSIWSFLSTRGFALQITTRSQKCLNYQPDSRLSHTYLHTLHNTHFTTASFLPGLTSQIGFLVAMIRFFSHRILYSPGRTPENGQ